MTKNKAILNCDRRNLQSLIIPDTCVNLVHVWCADNNLQSLVIPKSCINIRTIYCYNNHLNTLIIPDTCILLQEIWCYGNKLNTLIIPDTLTQLRIINCFDNTFPCHNLPELRIFMRFKRKYSAIVIYYVLQRKRQKRIKKRMFIFINCLDVYMQNQIEDYF